MNIGWWWLCYCVKTGANKKKNGRYKKGEVEIEPMCYLQLLIIFKAKTLNFETKSVTAQIRKLLFFFFGCEHTTKLATRIEGTCLAPRIGNDVFNLRFGF